MSDLDDKDLLGKEAKLPIIPERYSSLISISRQNGLNDIKKRKVSASSIVSTASSAAEFVVSKIEDASLGIEYVDEMRKGLEEAFDDENLSVSQYKEAIEDVGKYSKPKDQDEQGVGSNEPQSLPFHPVCASRDLLSPFNARPTRLPGSLLPYLLVEASVKRLQHSDPRVCRVY